MATNKDFEKNWNFANATSSASLRKKGVTGIPSACCWPLSIFLSSALEFFVLVSNTTFPLG
jgi:hypothetical protein